MLSAVSRGNRATVDRQLNSIVTMQEDKSITKCNQVGSPVPTQGQCVCGHCPPIERIPQLRLDWECNFTKKQEEEWSSVLKEIDNDLLVAHEWIDRPRVREYLSGVLCRIAERRVIKTIMRLYTFRPRCDGSALVAILRIWPSSEAHPNHYVAQFEFSERDGAVRSYVATLGKALLALARGLYRGPDDRKLSDISRVVPVFDDEDILVQYEDDLHHWIKGVTILSHGCVAKCRAPFTRTVRGVGGLMTRSSASSSGSDCPDLIGYNGVSWRSGQPIVIQAGIIKRSVSPQMIHMDFPGRLVRGGKRQETAQFFFDLSKDEEIPQALRHRLANEFGYSPYGTEFDAAWTEFKNAWRTADNVEGHVPPDYRDFHSNYRGMPALVDPPVEDL